MVLTGHTQFGSKGEDWTQRPTTNNEICSIVPDCKFYSYSDLWKVRELSELLPKSIILYQSPGVGHWIGIFQNREGINVFDSLGYEPDYEIKNLTKPARDKFNENFTYLTSLLCQAPYIIYNAYRYQSKNTSTCGMHVAFRLLHSELTEEEYKNIMDRIKNKDLFVSNFFRRKLLSK